MNRQLGDAGEPQTIHSTASNEGDFGEPDVLNLASRAELAKISVVGKDRAQAIIEHRSIYGRFHSWTELAKVPGFDDQRVDTVRRVAVDALRHCG